MLSGFSTSVVICESSWAKFERYVPSVALVELQEVKPMNKADVNIGFVNWFHLLFRPQTIDGISYGCFDGLTANGKYSNNDRS